jgi:shikimate dehydrogenase
MPHKQAVMPFLDHIDPLAKRIGAVNAIAVGEGGKLSGFNFDGIGFVQSVYDASPGWRPDTGPVVLLGAGGAARAILAALVDQGAKEIRLLNRTCDRAKQLVAEIGGPVSVLPWEGRDAALDGAALVVNATDRGFAGKPPLELALDALPRGAIAADVIYIPPETPFLEAARARGNVTVNGIGMLLNQARFGFETWFGVRPDITPELVEAVKATF